MAVNVFEEGYEVYKAGGGTDSYDVWKQKLFDSSQDSGVFTDFNLNDWEGFYDFQQLLSPLPTQAEIDAAVRQGTAGARAAGDMATQTAELLMEAKTLEDIPVEAPDFWMRTQADWDATRAAQGARILLQTATSADDLPLEKPEGYLGTQEQWEAARSAAVERIEEGDVSDIPDDAIQSGEMPDWWITPGGDIWSKIANKIIGKTGEADVTPPTPPVLPPEVDLPTIPTKPIPTAPPEPGDILPPEVDLPTIPTPGDVVPPVDVVPPGDVVPPVDVVPPGDVVPPVDVAPPTGDLSVSLSDADNNITVTGADGNVVYDGPISGLPEDIYDQLPEDFDWGANQPPTYEAEGEGLPDWLTAMFPFLLQLGLGYKATEQAKGAAKDAADALRLADEEARDRMDAILYGDPEADPDAPGAQADWNVMPEDFPGVYPSLRPFMGTEKAANLMYKFQLGLGEDPREDDGRGVNPFYDLPFVGDMEDRMGQAIGQYAANRGISRAAPTMLDVGRASGDLYYQTYQDYMSRLGSAGQPVATTNFGNLATGQQAGLNYASMVTTRGINQANVAGTAAGTGFLGDVAGTFDDYWRSLRI